MRASASKGLFLSIDPRSRQPLQAQIYSAIRAAILEGVLAPGASLQSSRALAADLRVSRTTTLLAYEQLTAEGYLSARRGSGTFVALELPDDLPRASTSGPSSHRIIRPCPDAAQRSPRRRPTRFAWAGRRAPSVSACPRSICSRSNSGLRW